MVHYTNRTPSSQYLLFTNGHPFWYWPDTTLLNVDEVKGTGVLKSYGRKPHLIKNNYIHLVFILNKSFLSNIHKKKKKYSVFSYIT